MQRHPEHAMFWLSQPKPKLLDIAGRPLFSRFRVYLTYYTSRPITFRERLLPQFLIGGSLDIL